GWTHSVRSGRRFQAPTISLKAATALSMSPRASRCCVWPAPATRRARSSPSSTERRGGWPFLPLGARWAAAAAPASGRAAGAGGRQSWFRQVEAQPLRCLTSVTAAADGSIFMTDGSSRHERDVWVRDLMEKNHFGRLVTCGAGLDGAKSLLRELSYPHGVSI